MSINASDSAPPRTPRQQLADKLPELGVGAPPTSFTGSDISALIIMPDDETRLRLIQKWLEDQVKGIESKSNGVGTNYGGVQQISDAQAYEDYITGGDRSFLKNITTPPASVEKTDSFLRILNLTSITTSTFRTKQQVRSIGHVNPTGIARGTRTIAGTMILTEYDKDTFWDIITNGAFMQDIGLGSQGDPILIDQIPPFDMLLLFQNEFGSVAYRYISGIEIVTNGNVYSILDMYNENTLSFICMELSPLTPKDISEGNWSVTKGVKRVDNLASITSAKELTRRYRQSLNARDTRF